MNVPDWLTALGIPENCITQQSAAQEGRRRFSIRPEEGDEIWRVKVDGCWLTGSENKRIDYLFWGESASGRKMILLVELKGSNFGKALEQIESTLNQLCKKSENQGIHTGIHHSSPGHDIHNKGGIRAYTVLSKGGGVGPSQAKMRRIQQRYGVRIVAYGQQLTVTGLDNLRE